MKPSGKTFTLLLLSLFLFPAVYAQRTTISGKIVDSTGHPVAFAQIVIKNTNRAASANDSGEFKLDVNPEDSLIVSRVGFFDTTVFAGGRNPLRIVLALRNTVYQEAVVTGTNPTADKQNAQAATKEQIIANAFQTYAQDAAFSNGQFRATYVVPVPQTAGQIGHAQVRMSVTTVNGFGPLNTLSSGTMLPVMTHQEDTRGRRYLLKDFAHGIIVDNSGHVISDSTLLMNFDKIDGQLMIAQNAKSYLEVDKEKVLAFAFKTPDTSFVFLNVPVLSKINYFQLIATGRRYSVYKSIRTRFVKANYVSNGLTESGNNYDEYVDTETWFWVDSKDSAGIFELKKKSIKSAFSGEKPRIDTWFSKHKLDDIDDNFVRGLINYLNEL